MNASSDGDAAELNASGNGSAESPFPDIGGDVYLQHFAHGLLAMDKEFYVMAIVFIAVSAVPPGLFIVVQIVRYRAPALQIRTQNY